MKQINFNGEHSRILTLPWTSHSTALLSSQLRVSFYPIPAGEFWVDAEQLTLQRDSDR